MPTGNLPQWTNPQWQDDDIFKLSKMDIDTWKVRVATAVGVRWRSQGLNQGQLPWALPVAGTEPISEAKVNEAVKLYSECLRKVPKPEEQQEWNADLRSKSQLSTVVNGCFLSWEPAAGPFNTGYIASFWSKFESGEKQWDVTIDRKAGGVEVSMEKPIELNALKFSVAGVSSIMALMRAVLGHVVRTGSCPAALALAFKSIRITWLFTASVQEILTLSVIENIEQHERRRHSELENIFQVEAWVKSMHTEKIANVSLDPTKALDVVKYALALGNPLFPDDVSDWLRSLLQGKPPTFKNKLVALQAKGVTKRFLDDKKAKICHPEMNSYAKVVLRVRAVNGFHEFKTLHELISEELGRRGLLNKAFPFSPTLLLDQNILTSDAFSGNEKSAVPTWRDGAAGRELQKGMVEVARRRLFDHDQISSGKMAFVSGTNWVAFTRLCGPPFFHFNAILEKHFDVPSRWTDSVKAFDAALWSGEYDTELSKLSSLLPGTLDTQPSQFQRRVSEMFPPLLHLLQTKDTEAARLTSQSEREAEAEKQRKEEEEKTKASQDKEDAKEVPDGDVTDDLFKDQDAAGKRNLCLALNKDAVKKREQAMERSFHVAAMAVLRTRVIVVEDAVAVKAYMESASKEGLKARLLYMDVSQFPSTNVVGKWSNNLAKQPTKEQQKTFGQSALTVPVTPITGSLLLRTCHVSLEIFNEEVSRVFPASYQKTLFVPIDIPPAYERAIRSAASRALGPPSLRSEKSGVEFHFRAVGGRNHSQGEDQKQSLAEQGDEEVDDDEEEEQEVVEEASDGMPIDSLSKKQLQGLFGRDALNMMGAMFQHSSQIGEPARFQSFDKSIQYTKASGKRELYRKSQLHPTAVNSAINLVLASNSAGISPGECFVQLSGGTPEPLVGAILAGFTKVFYVAQSESERNWMKMPSTHDEKVHAIDYMNYVSPEPDFPDQGFMAVEAAKMLAPYIKNFVLETTGSLMVPTPIEIVIPPLQTFTYIAVTGKVIARTMQQSTSQPSTQSVHSSSSQPSSSARGGPGSASGAQAVATPKAKGKVKGAGKAAEEEAEENDEENEEEDEDVDAEPGEEDDADLVKELEQLEAQNEPGPKKKRKTPPTPNADSKKKKKKQI